MSILAAKQHGPDKPLVTVADIVREHWKQFGKNFFTRYDYEECATDGANAMMAHLNKIIADPSTKGKKFGNYTVVNCDDFEYRDPIDGSVSKNQGIRFIFGDGSRIIYRLSGTGSTGATIRVYIDQYEPDPSRHHIETQDALKELIAIALDISQLQRFTGREKPTVIT